VVAAQEVVISFGQQRLEIEPVLGKLLISDRFAHRRLGHAGSGLRHRHL
jgi:hypothetical protein